MTALVTSATIALCFRIRRHYRRVQGDLVRLDEALGRFQPEASAAAPQPEMVRREPTAILTVDRFGERAAGGRFVAVGEPVAADNVRMAERVGHETFVRGGALRLILNPHQTGVKLSTIRRPEVEFADHHRHVHIRGHRKFSNRTTVDIVTEHIAVPRGDLDNGGV